MNFIEEDFEWLRDAHLCGACTSLEDKLQGATYWVESLKKRIYDESFNQEEFEWDFDELCSVLGIPFKRKELKITVTA